MTKACFGDTVVAYRPVEHVEGSHAHGEMGIALGINIKYPGSIYFYSLGTGRVKLRTRIRVVDSVDLTSVLGRNLEYVPPAKVYKSLTAYNLSKSEEAASAGILTKCEVDEDEVDKIEVEQGILAGGIMRWNLWQSNQEM